MLSKHDVRENANPIGYQDGGGPPIVTEMPPPNPPTHRQVVIWGYVSLVTFFSLSEPDIDIDRISEEMASYANYLHYHALGNVYII